MVDDTTPTRRDLTSFEDHYAPGHIAAPAGHESYIAIDTRVYSRFYSSEL